MTSSTPGPLKNNATNEKIAEIISPILGISARVAKNVGVEVKGNYIILAFHNEGSCSIIYSISVSYYFCLQFTLGTGLVSLPLFTAPVDKSEPVVTNAVYNQGTLLCTVRAMVFGLTGRCVCRQDTENRGRGCKGI